jgi:hypothetical protein
LAQRAQHHKLAVGLEPAANVLEGENVTVFDQFLKYAAGKGAISAVDAVRRALKENRQRFAMRLRGVNDRMQLDTVAHGNHLFNLFETLRRIGWIFLTVNRRGGDQDE